MIKKKDMLMKMKLFDNLSREEIVVAPIEAKEIDPVEALETIDAFTEIQSIEDEAAVAREAIDIADTVVASLGKQLDVERSALDLSTDVNGTVVAMSIETLKSTALILGVNMDTVDVSKEAIEADPAEALKMSIEAKDDFMKKVIDNIKLLFKKFMALMKKLYTKAVVALSGVAATAEKLKETLEKNEKYTPTVIDINDTKMVLDITSSIGGLIAASGGQLNKEFGDIVYHIMSGGELKAILETVKLANNISTAIKENIDLLEKNKEYEGDSVNKSLKSIKESYDKEVTPYKFSGNSFKILEVYIPEIDNNETYTRNTVEKILKQITIKPTVVNISSKDTIYELYDFNFDLSKGEVNFTATVRYEDLIYIVGKLIDPAKNIKKTFKEVEKITNDLITITKSIPEEDVYMPVVKLGNVVVSSVAMDIVLGIISGIRETLKTVNMLGKVAMSRSKY